MHTVFALLCFVVVIDWLIFPYPSGLLHWHCGNLTIAPVPAKQPWWIWINTSCEFIMNDCITTTKQRTTKPCAYFLGYTVCMYVRGRIELFYAVYLTYILFSISNLPFLTRLSNQLTRLKWSIDGSSNHHGKYSRKPELSMFVSLSCGNIDFVLASAVSHVTIITQML